MPTKKIGQFFREKRSKPYREDSMGRKSFGEIKLSTCECQFSVEKLKCFIIQESKGRIIFPHNDKS